MIWKRNLLFRLLAPYLATLVAIVASLYIFTDRVVANLYVETLSQGALHQARLVGDLLPWGENGKVLDERCAQLAAKVDGRITVIAADGTVLGDSATPSANLQNHAERPEVQAAMRDGEGHGSRVSASVQQPLLYSAWRQTRGDEERVIRLSIPVRRVHDLLSQIRLAALLGIAIAALAALWPALAISRRVEQRVERLAQFAAEVERGEQPPDLTPQGADAIGQLEQRLIDIATSLSKHLQTARGEQQKLEAALRGMVEGVLVIDDWGTVVLCNERAEELFGVLPGESCLGRSLIEVTRQPELHQVVRDVMESGEGADPIIREIVLEGPRQQVLQITANPLTGPGSARTYILVCHDITELTRLQNNQREFVANVSHELRTPLAAIQGYSETLLSGALEDPEKARGFLAIVERHAKRLGRLVDDLLALSDLELGRTELRRRPVAAETVIESACEVLQERARDRGLTFRQEVASDLPLLDIDPDRVVEALINLVDNAVKYTSEGGNVTVTARPAEQAEVRNAPPNSARREWVEIAVADTGVGIPSQDLPQLTRRFYRVDKGRSRELGGTGLGLAIVKHIVQVHDGWLRIDSALGHGTTVRVYLPALSPGPNASELHGVA